LEDARDESTAETQRAQRNAEEEGEKRFQISDLKFQIEEKSELAHCRGIYI
jgi:hypothetical protein